MMENRVFKAHPWHGISQGEQYPEIVRAFVEIVPTDTVKYEVDKVKGQCLKISVVCPKKGIPTLYQPHILLYL